MIRNRARCSSIRNTHYALLLLVASSIGLAAGCQWIADIDHKESPAPGGGGALVTTVSVTSSASAASVANASSTATTGGSGDAGVGCSDGTREGFADYETIAGCLATWVVQSMRADPKGGVVCGNSINDGSCPTPADACATGWHVCMRHGWPGDLQTRIRGGKCYPEMAPTPIDAMFFAASSQQLPDAGCAMPMPCDMGDELSDAICCGYACDTSVSNCVFPEPETPHGGGACGAFGNDNPAWGVLCCKDPEVMTEIPRLPPIVFH